MARHGKIARLKHEHRSRVNEMLRDGASAARVISFVEKLVAAGERDADGRAIEIPNDQNITNWRDGGYQDWLKEQERLADMKHKREFALEIVRQNEGSKLQEATLHLAASQLYDALTDFDIAGLKELLADKPEHFTQVVNSLAKLSKGALDVEKFKDNVRQRKEAIEGALNAAKKAGGLSRETISTIEQELKLL